MQNGDFYLNDLWTRTLKSVAETKQVNEEVFDLYFNGSTLTKFDAEGALVCVPNFINYSIMSSYRELIEKCFEEVVGSFIPISLIEEKDFKEQTHKEGFLRTDSIIELFPLQNIDETETFSNFVVGRSNAQARVAAETAAREPGFVYNPLFIYGDSGIGKTHLLNAIGNYVKDHFPDKKIGFITGADFVDDVYKASKEKQYDELKDTFKGLDLLLVDDIQFIADKPKSHEVFFTIFNYLVNNKKQICVTSDKSPDEIKGLEARLITRFNQGLTVNIIAPEYETAINILKMKIDNNISISQQIDEEVISYIATNFSQNVRSLEGALRRLLFYSINWSTDKDHIGIDLAYEAFKDQILSNKDTLSFTRIKKTVCDYYNISKEQLISKNKTKNIATARHIAIYLCRKLLDAPYDKIGSEFGKRDHSTIMNSCEKVENLIKTDSLYLTVLNEIEKKLAN